MVPTKRRGQAFPPSFILFLAFAQTAYAAVYVHSSLLRSSVLLQVAWRLIVWTLPVVVFLLYSRQKILEYLKLRQGALRGIAWGAAVGVVLIALNLAGAYFIKGNARINLHISGALWWKAIVLVGFSEEVVFRGFFLPEFAKKMRFWVANLAQATLFLLIHCPGWMLLGQFHLPGILRMCGFVFFAGVVLGVVWKKTDSLWACILIHSFSNFCSLAIL